MRERERIKKSKAAFLGEFVLNNSWPEIKKRGLFWENGLKCVYLWVKTEPQHQHPGANTVVFVGTEEEEEEQRCEYREQDATQPPAV